MTSNDVVALSSRAQEVRPGRSGNPLVIVSGADDHFAKPLAVTLHSAVSNYRGGPPLRIFIIDGGIKSSNRERIRRILGELGAEAEWLEPDWTPVQHLAVSARYPRSVYLRVLIPRMLPRWVDKAIYLDSDLIVNDNVGELWDVDFRGKVLLAVQDEGASTLGSPWGLSNCRELGLDPSAMYFNSGVLVFDLCSWRERGLAKQVIDYIAAHPDQLRWGEQDALNAVVAGKWGALDPKWNQLVSPWEGHAGRIYRHGILHFVSPSKPWEPAGAHWTNFIYDRHLRRSGWYNWIEWWRYYIPLVVQRHWVTYVRARTLLTPHFRP